MLHQVGVLFDLYYDARKHKSKIHCFLCLFTSDQPKMLTDQTKVAFQQKEIKRRPHVTTQSAEVLVIVLTGTHYVFSGRGA